jgi:hypothetical protein
MNTEQASPGVRGVPALIAAVIAVGLMVWSFVVGIGAALDGSGSGALPYEILFVACGVVVLVSLVWAIINLVRWRSPVVAILTILVAALPIVGVVVLRMAAMA